MEVNANGLLPPPEVEGEEAISHSTAWVGAVKVGITGSECSEVDVRKTRVGVGALRVDKGQLQAVGQREGLTVNLATAYDVNMLRALTHSDGYTDRRGHLNTRSRIGRIAGDYDVASARERAFGK